MPEALLISNILPAALEWSEKQKKTYIAAIISLAVITVIVVVIVIIVKKRKKKQQDATDQEANERLLGLMNSEIQSDEITLTQAQFNACVNKLVAAMSGWGTNEAKVYEVFEEMNTRSDVLQLIKTFGVKESQNLNEWLHDDLNTNEIAHINQILSTKNINYMF